MTAGDGASASSESFAQTGFTSGDAFRFAGSIGTSEVEYVLANYGFSGGAFGFFFENVDTTNFVTLSLRTGSGSGSDIITAPVAPGGCFVYRMDDAATDVTHVALQADSAACDVVLFVCE